ncbi:zinc-ribbon domain-containing protein [Phaeobacter sp. B1627]|uniref:zinc-ribbon domain-containing protein n=1 Tax=Phaeobacter sp. B1627 TaxID=2583809 RepID=UPI00111A2401|nr:zinc-ribbon domain-containing protein [Phaeobacter sp. B1627]TNJ47655.1 thioredoxin [Phaeobacter sp. B1627]
MRLICPNCGAQYEVPEDVIPDEGRDVQCSNCGDTWFQSSARMLAQQALATPEAPAGDEGEAAPPPHAEPPLPHGAEEMSSAASFVVAEETVSAGPDHVEDEDISAEPAPDVPEEPEAEAPEEKDAADEAPSAVETAANEPVKRRLDPDVSKVLREEAMREAALRSGREGLETQTEMGLDAPSDTESTRRARQAQDRMARMRGETLAAQPDGLHTPPSVEPGSRRGLLPDIEDINPGLAVGERNATRQASETKRPRKSSFSRGLLLMVVLMVAAILIYTHAPDIAERVPQADPYISAYVAWVDHGRIWLDAQAKALAAE